MLKMDCKHIDEYIDRGNGIVTDWCLLHDCTNCDDCTKYKKQITGGVKMSELSNITLYWGGKNYCCYSDWDSQSDYFPGYNINTKQTIEWIKQDGANLITVDVINNDSDIPIQKRLDKICKECGYGVTDKSYINKSPATGQEWFIYKYELTKN